MDSLVKRNPGLVEAAVMLHQSGQIPPNTYLFDLDAHRKNARVIVREAKKNGISLYYMSKQVGRNPLVCKAVLGEGFRGVVAVEVQCANSLHRYGIRIGHVGHLVQPPAHDIEYVLGMDPEVWTVYSLENATLVSRRAEKMGRVQKVLVQPVAGTDLFFDTMSGGIPEENIVEEVRKINALPGVKVVGTTSFPCLLYSLATRKVEPISNFHTVVRVAERLQKELGIEVSQINAPGNNYASNMKLIAENGGTQAEPGNGVSGANSEHVFDAEQPEIPAFTYVSEVSHQLGEKLYTQGGGMSHSGGGWGTFPDGKLWVGGTDIAMDAIVGSSPKQAIANRVEAKYPGMDPFNYNLTLFPGKRHFSVGDTVLFGFCVLQVFVTRAWHAVVEGIEDDNPRLLGIFDQGDNLIDRHGRPLGDKAALKLLDGV
jgi:predicted amino acid racemase